MSADTPRTNVNVRFPKETPMYLGPEFVYADFARELEREINELKQEVETMKEGEIPRSYVARCVGDRDETIKELRRRIDELEVERDRTPPSFDAVSEKFMLEMYIKLLDRLMEHMDKRERYRARLDQQMAQMYGHDWEVGHRLKLAKATLAAVDEEVDKR